MSALPAANPLLRLWGAYSRSLQARPVVTKMTAAVLIFTASDLGTQYLTREIPMPPPSPPPPSPHAAGAKRRRAGEGAGTAAAPPPSLPSPPFAPDCRRALSAAAFGAVGTVYLHHWWNLLEVLVGARFPPVRAAGPGSPPLPPRLRSIRPCRPHSTTGATSSSRTWWRGGTPSPPVPPPARVPPPPGPPP